MIWIKSITIYVMLYHDIDLNLEIDVLTIQSIHCFIDKINRCEGLFLANPLKSFELNYSITLTFYYL